jgi:hypothetical protein
LLWINPRGMRIGRDRQPPGRLMTKGTQPGTLLA